jgi:L-arabinose isomerase
MRLIVQEVDAVTPEHAMPKLPVARAMWTPRPDFKRGCQAWLLAGGGHHTSWSQAVTGEQLEDLAAMLDVEHVRIGFDLNLAALKKELRWNDRRAR